MATVAHILAAGARWGWQRWLALYLLTAYLFWPVGMGAERVFVLCGVPTGGHGGPYIAPPAEAVANLLSTLVIVFLGPITMPMIVGAMTMVMLDGVLLGWVIFAEGNAGDPRALGRAVGACALVWTASLVSGWIAYIIVLGTGRLLRRRLQREK